MIFRRASNKNPIFFSKLFAGRKCPYCGGTDTTDNGDSWYCYDCNATFEHN